MVYRQRLTYLSAEEVIIILNNRVHITWISNAQPW